MHALQALTLLYQGSLPNQPQSRFVILVGYETVLEEIGASSPFSRNFLIFISCSACRPQIVFSIFLSKDAQNGETENRSSPVCCLPLIVRPYFRRPYFEDSSDLKKAVLSHRQQANKFRAHFDVVNKSQLLEHTAKV